MALKISRLSFGLSIFHIFSVVNQEYMARVHGEDVIQGNNALVKCSIPSFVADLISVISWEDTAGNIYNAGPLSYGKL